MGARHQIAAALIAVAGLHGASAANDVTADHQAGTGAGSAPAPAQLILTCEKQGEWKSIPAADPSAMGQLGKRLCTDQNFTAVLPEAGLTRDKYFTQLSLAHRHLSQLAQLGRSINGGDLTSINLPNMYVVEKPHAAARGGIVYQFELIVRQPVGEGGAPLAEERINGTTRSGKLTGLLEIAPTGRSLSYSTP